MNKWSEQFNVKYPNCNMCGQCCKCASPSSPTEELIAKSKNGDGFAKDFIDIFIPYKNIKESQKACPDVVKRSLKACEKPSTKVKADQLVFYHCKYIGKNNSCLIHEDRPKLCRDYPDMPFLIFPKNCAYENWSIECKKKYHALMEELRIAKEMQKQVQQEMENYKIQQNVIRKLQLLNKTNDESYKFAVLCPNMCIVSPKFNKL